MSENKHCTLYRYKKKTEVELFTGMNGADKYEEKSRIHPTVLHAS
jgi:hypothetical protein